MTGRPLLHLALVVGAYLLGAGAALSCTPAPGWYAKARVSADVAARVMAREAVFIDIAVADRMTSDFEVGTRQWASMRAAPKGSHLHKVADSWLAGTREAWAEDGARIHFRVVERLKGHSPPEFTLGGSKEFEKDKQAPRAVPLSQLHYFLDIVDLIDGPGMGDCTMPVFAQTGRRYLIFRGADGLPLRIDVPVRFSGQMNPRSGPSVVPIISINDPWPKLVRQALTQGD